MTTARLQHEDGYWAMQRVLWRIENNRSDAAKRRRVENRTMWEPNSALALYVGIEKEWPCRHYLVEEDLERAEYELRGIKVALHTRGRCDQFNHTFGWWCFGWHGHDPVKERLHRTAAWIDRMFHCAKAALCCLLQLERTKRHGRYPDTVVLGSFDHHQGSTPDGTWYSWEEVRVGAGFFRNWFFEIKHESG